MKDAEEEEQEEAQNGEKRESEGATDCDLVVERRRQPFTPKSTDDL